jgi:capsular polysaccharide biosynthesis protein
VQPDSNILVRLVEGPNPQVAASLANNMGQNGLNYINGLYQVYTLSFLDQAAGAEQTLCAAAAA